jgi:osmotically-inducible protein OsmY
MDIDRMPKWTLRGAGKKCAALVFAAAFAAGCATSAHATRSRADEELATRANGALAAAGFDCARLEARSYRGVVVLLGVADDRESREAQSVLAAVPGVVRVNNLVSTESARKASESVRPEGPPIVAVR